MKKLQRYNLADYAIRWVKGDDGEVCIYYNVAELEASHAEMLEALEDLVSLAEVAMTAANCDGAEYEVGEELRVARAAIAKAKGEQP